MAPHKVGRRGTELEIRALVQNEQDNSQASNFRNTKQTSDVEINCSLKSVKGKNQEASQKL